MLVGRAAGTADDTDDDVDEAPPTRRDARTAAASCWSLGRVCAASAARVLMAAHRGELHCAIACGESGRVIQMRTRRWITTRKWPGSIVIRGTERAKKRSGGKINLPDGCTGRVLQGCGHAAWDSRAPSYSCSHVVGSRLASRSATCQHHWCRGLEAGSPCGHSRSPAAADGAPRWRWRRSRRE
jgi:hypothetical protein